MKKKRIIIKNNLNKVFWEKHYSKSRIKSPSNFALFIKKKILKKKIKINLLDLGCGDGRDSFYFAKNSKTKVIGIDKSSIAINKNNFYKKIEEKNNLFFFNFDVKNPKIKNLSKFDVIYLRFFLHSINLKTQNILFKNINQMIKKKGIICLEFRTIKDPLFKKGKILSKYERFIDHYRRFINLSELINTKFIKSNCRIKYLIERKGLSKFKNDNPVVARLVLEKK